MYEPKLGFQTAVCETRACILNRRCFKWWCVHQSGARVYQVRVVPNRVSVLMTRIMIHTHPFHVHARINALSARNNSRTPFHVHTPLIIHTHQGLQTAPIEIDYDIVKYRKGIRWTEWLLRKLRMKSLHACHVIMEPSYWTFWLWGWNACNYITLLSKCKTCFLILMNYPLKVIFSEGSELLLEDLMTCH